MTKTMLVLAGAALGFGGTANAANPSLDIDRALAAELRADAAGRTSLLQGAGSAGYNDTTRGGGDGGFYIQDASGNYELNIGALLQFRYVLGIRDDDGSVDEEFTHGFERPRTALWLQGHIVNPQITYRVEFDAGIANSNQSSGALRDAWVRYEFDGEGQGAYVQWGQFVVPILHEENVRAQFTQGLERGPVNEFFTPGWSEGILLGYNAESFAIAAAFTDGVRAPTGFGATAGTAYGGMDTDYGIAVRGDLKFGGDWIQFNDHTSPRGSNNAGKLGGGILYQSGGDTGTAGGGATLDAEYLLWTVDFTYEGDGWNVFAAYIGHSLDIDGGLDVTNHGFVLQGGLYVSDQVEIFGGWNWLSLDDDLTGAWGLSDEDYHFLNLGANYYFVPNSHAIKLTVDALWALDDNLPTDSVSNQADTNLLGGTEDEFLIRAQVQVLF